jgi:uncharacterized membrane protein YeaQ/YmgE (transglycosylase-associated protein family)
MVSKTTNRLATEPETSTETAERQVESWVGWPVYWSAVWTGALTALAVAVIIGLIGIAVGAHVLGVENRIVDLKKASIIAVIFGVCGAFFSFAAGGWVAGKVAGILRSETGMLHGAIVWMTALPLMLALAGIGAGSLFGGWYAGLSGTPSWANAQGAPFDVPTPPVTGATASDMDQYRADVAEYRANVKRWKEETPAATRNSALGAVTAVLLGLVGAVLGGWLASGEPMNFTHWRTRDGRAVRTT